MIERMKSWLLAISLVALVGGTVGSLVVTPSVGAVSTTPLPVKTTTCENAGKFLTFPPWYRGLNPVDPNDPTKATDCSIVSPSDVGGLDKFIWTIVLNIIEIGLNVVGYISVGFIIYGGFLLMVGRGMPENITKARLTIRDAIVGLIISIGSIAIVNLIVGSGILG